MSKEHLQAAVRKMTDSVNKLRGHCDIMLLNDALQSWQKEQESKEGKYTYKNYITIIFYFYPTGISKQDCCVVS